MKFIELDFVEKPKNLYSPSFMRKKPDNIAIKIPTMMKYKYDEGNGSFTIKEKPISISFLINYLESVKICLRANGYTSTYIEDNIICANRYKDPTKPYYMYYNI